MERNDAIIKLKQLENVDLVSLARKYDVTIWKGEKKNKGWAGHVLERYLGLPINSAQSPNFGSWELKIVPLKRLADGTIAVKETMAITMIDPFNVKTTPFEESHLLAKLKKAVICARLFESQEEKRSVLVRVVAFELDDHSIYEQVKQDYEETRRCIIKRGFEHLTGAMGVLVQPRTKGARHGSTSRAFYARTQFVAKLLGIQ
ncbi:MAG: Type-2 restriction enzyme Sau3AI [Dehalococcoidia bacterium]|nr:Type-2 restriction enzyme Sau3AI [Bacillota bacterium]MBT9143839.1 Type-2 restriction enzyme Sau3AI [Bacillota bacterium]